MLKRVRIQSFKSLVDVSVELDPVTVLVGRSGSGKTNFVEAIRLLRNYLTLRNDSFIYSAPGGWEHVLSALGRPDSALSYDVEFSVKGRPQQYRYRLRFHTSGAGGTPYVDEEALWLGGQKLFHAQEQKWATEPPVVGIGPEGLVLGRLMGIQEVSIAHVFLTQGIGCYDFPGDVFKTAPQSEPQVTGLRDHGENHVDAVSAILRNLSSLESWNEVIAGLQRLNPAVKNVDLIALQKPAKIMVSQQVKDKVLVLELAQQSEGLRRFLAYFIALYQSPPKQTLIFEEPEKGIHPGALAVLADQFKAYASSGRGQVILTTHSPQLLDYFAPENIRVVEIDNYQTRIGPLAPEQLESLKEKLLRPGELLTVDYARAEPARA